MNRTPEEIVSGLLEKRGYATEEAREEFLSPRPQLAYDPFLLRNMEPAVELILSEIDKGTRICIYGDYDADGVTSVCILYSFLKHLTDDLFYYIPSRFTDGYGLNNDAIRRIREDGAGLIITVDCGSVSYSEVEYAKSIGLKVIVTDHHTIGDVSADCILINPKQEGETYPFRELAGCGVAFKLAQAITIRKGLPKGILHDSLDLVAIGTVADIVPLLDENRTLVKYGLMKINSGSRMSVRKLMEGISLARVSSRDISYGIGPHVNAAGRMGSAEEAAKLFLAEDEETAEAQTKILKDVNAERRSLQEQAFEDCIARIGDEDFILLYMPDIHEGISGIVAGKIKEQKERPCVIITSAGEGRLKGTGRSTETIDLHGFLKEFADLFITFGGHKRACGFTLPEAELGRLREGVAQKAARMRRESPELFEPIRRFDDELHPGEATMGLIEEIDKLEPFGEANKPPEFLMKGVKITDIRYMGAESQHVRFTASGSDGSVECILFKRGEEFGGLIGEGDWADILGRVEGNTWNGRTRPQFKVRDFKK